MWSLAGLLTFAILCLVSLGEVAAKPVRNRKSSEGCAVRSKRKAWHTLTEDEKRDYLTAEICVMSMPGKANLPGAVTVFDELVSNHQIQALQIHSTGSFLPYFRYLLHAHELFMRECGYTGTIPWWDETLDAGKFSVAEIFDPLTGFGGDGWGWDRCILDGPFVNYTTRAGPGFSITDRCISRLVNDVGSALSSQAEVDGCMTFETYEQFWVCIYMNPHLGGHLGAGRMMGDSLVAPADPTFYLHHAWIDKLWWDWQNTDLENRLYDISGPNQQDPEIGFYEYPGNMSEEAELYWGYPDDVQTALAPSGQDGDPGNETTLNHVLSTLGVIEDAVVGDVMDIRNDYLCYEYE